MKYDLIGQINNYFKNNNKEGKLDVSSDKIKLLHDSDIPELKGIKVDKNGFCSEGVLLISVDGKKFALYGDLEKVTIESTNSVFCVSVSEKSLFLQCSIENDIVKTSLEDSNLIIQIYTDILKNGKMIDDLKNLIPDTVQLINIEFDIKNEKENNKRTLIIKYDNKKRKIKVPIYMSLVNIIRLLSNVIREEYRKNIGILEVQRLIKQI